MLIDALITVGSALSLVLAMLWTKPVLGIIGCLLCLVGAYYLVLTKQRTIPLGVVSFFLFLYGFFLIPFVPPPHERNIRLLLIGGTVLLGINSFVIRKVEMGKVGNQHGA